MTAVSRATPIRISAAVAAAVADGSAVVALESTLITHGLPRPENLAAGRGLEAVVRANGAVPATIGVLRGELVVGLTDDELSYLASVDADKASTWNLAAVMAAGRDAGTTVATTLLAADLAGIAVFATGGIGGVHFAAFDESADLAALTRHPVLTVCAGPKSILDVRATLERLETAGVPVVGYRSDTLAGFLMPATDLRLSSRVDSPAAAARVLATQRELGLDAAVVLSNPVSAGLTREQFSAYLAEAEAGLRRDGVSGAQSTPYLLGALAEVSNGATVEVNTRLLRENAALAAQVATEYSRLASERRRAPVLASSAGAAR